MSNYKFKKAARLRKVSAFFLTLLTFFGLVGFVLFQFGVESSQVLDLITSMFSEPIPEKPSVNYP